MATRAVGKDQIICPESTIESANRRNFIRKAALTTAVVGIGSTFLAGKNLGILPESTASSDSPVSGCCPIGYGVRGSSSSGTGVEAVSDTGYGIYAESICGTGVFGCGAKRVGVVGISNCGIGVKGISQTDGIAATSCTIGVYGQATNGTGVKASSTTGVAMCACSTCHTGVYGVGKTYGVHGYSSNSTGIGVYGNSNNACGVGVYGASNCGTAVKGSGKTGVVGITASNQACAFAIHGILCNSVPGAGSAAVRGTSRGTGCLGIGVYGSQCGSGYGVYGHTPKGAGVYGGSCSGSGVYGCSTSGKGVQGLSSTGIGVYGATCSTAGDAIGVEGIIESSSPGVCSVGVRGINRGTGRNGIGVYGTQCGSGTGVFGGTPKGRGVYGYSTSGVGVTGTSPGGIGVAGCSLCCIGILAYSSYYIALWAQSCTPSIGMFKRLASPGDRSSFVQFANGDSTPVEWNVGVAGLCNSIKVPDGNFYVQYSSSIVPAISVKKCNNHVGIGVSDPCRALCVNGRIRANCGIGIGTNCINTTLAVNGSISMKSRQVKAATCIGLSDYAVFANAECSAFTVTLPSIVSTAGSCDGMVLFIKKIDCTANAVTVAAYSKTTSPKVEDTIECNPSILLKKKNDSVQLISNNSTKNSNCGHTWFILQSAKCGTLLT
jgi:hypothetical protein